LWRSLADALRAASTIFEDVRPCIEANHLDPARVRKVLRETFAPRHSDPEARNLADTHG